MNAVRKAHALAAVPFLLAAGLALGYEPFPGGNLDVNRYLERELQRQVREQMRQAREAVRTQMLLDQDMLLRAHVPASYVPEQREIVAQPFPGASIGLAEEYDGAAYQPASATTQLGVAGLGASWTDVSDGKTLVPSTRTIDAMPSVAGFGAGVSWTDRHDGTGYKPETRAIGFEAPVVGVQWQDRFDRTGYAPEARDVNCGVSGAGFRAGVGWHDEFDGTKYQPASREVTVGHSWANVTYHDQFDGTSYVPGTRTIEVGPPELKVRWTDRCNGHGYVAAPTVQEYSTPLNRTWDDGFERVQVTGNLNTVETRTPAYPIDEYSRVTTGGYTVTRTQGIGDVNAFRQQWNLPSTPSYTPPSTYSPSTYRYTPPPTYNFNSTWRR